MLFFLSSLFQRKEKGNMRVHKLNNVEHAMDLLEKQKVRVGVFIVSFFFVVLVFNYIYAL